MPGYLSKTQYRRLRSECDDYISRLAELAREYRKAQTDALAERIMGEYQTVYEHLQSIRPTIETHERLASQYRNGPVTIS